MAMKVCKDCGTQVSKSAKTCPKCGKKLKHTTLGVILGIIILFIGIGSLAGDATNTLDNTPTGTIETITVVSRKNYDKIKEGMSEAQVQEMLGEPSSITESETPGVGKMILKHYQEGFSLKAIDIYFLDGKVYMKNWTEL